MKKATLTDSGAPAILDTDTGELTIVREKYSTIMRDAQPWKTPWNHDTDAESLSTALITTEPTKCQQHMADEANINNILAKFMNTGELPLIGEPRYMDIEKEFDLQSELVTGWQVQEAWNKLSPEVRNTLKDPKTFCDYVEHCLERGDLDPLRKLGLAVSKDPPTPPPAPPEPPQPPSPPGGSLQPPTAAKSP